MIEILIKDEFGDSLSDGEAAAHFRSIRIDPYLSLKNHEEIVLDFDGVKRANSSFLANLISGAVEEHGRTALERFAFRDCIGVIQLQITDALEIGVRRHNQRKA